MENDLELKNTEIKIKKEMRYFMALVVMSIAFGGIAMAIGIASITTNALALKTTDWIVILNLVSNIAISLIIAYLAFRYIISTAEVLSKFDDIQDEKDGELDQSSEKLTQRIVKLMGLYREEKPQIKRMILISNIAGICFLINAIIQMANLIGSFNIGTIELASATAGILVSLIMAGVGFFLPFSFRKYSVCWDERILKSTEAEKKIASFMEGHH